MDKDLEHLVNLISKIPSLGPRSARRIVLHLISNKEKNFRPLIEGMHKVIDNIATCVECGNIDSSDPCNICNNAKRNNSQLCIIEQVGDLWALERSKFFQGQYHVLGGVLSPIDGVYPADLRLGNLISRINKLGINEVIIANNATIDGQTTAHYIVGLLKHLPVKITQLPLGIPMGGELDYLDEGTLIAAMNARKNIE